MNNHAYIITYFYLFYSKYDELLEKRDPFVYFVLYCIIKCKQSENILKQTPCTNFIYYYMSYQLINRFVYVELK